MGCGLHVLLVPSHHWTSLVTCVLYLYMCYLHFISIVNFRLIFWQIDPQWKFYHYVQQESNTCRSAVKLCSILILYCVSDLRGILLCYLEVSIFQIVLIKKLIHCKKIYFVIISVQCCCCFVIVVVLFLLM